MGGHSHCGSRAEKGGRVGSLPRAGAGSALSPSHTEMDSGHFPTCTVFALCACGFCVPLAQA